MIVFESITPLDLIHERMDNEIKNYDGEKYYFIQDDIFLPIEEIIIDYGITLKNYTWDIYIKVKSDEKDIVWKKIKKD